MLYSGYLKLLNVQLQLPIKDMLALLLVVKLFTLMVMVNGELKTMNGVDVVKHQLQSQRALNIL